MWLTQQFSVLMMDRLAFYASICNCTNNKTKNRHFVNVNRFWMPDKRIFDWKIMTHRDVNNKSAFK